MRLLVVLLVPAFIGMVVSQNYNGMGTQQGNFNQRGGMRDQGRAPAGGTSRGGSPLLPTWVGGQQQHAGQQGNVNHRGQGTAPGAGGSSRRVYQNYPNYGGVQGGAQQPGPMQGIGGRQQLHQGQQGNVNHMGQGTLPGAGGSSRQVVPNYPNYGGQQQPGPIQGQVQHANQGAGPAPDQVGGSSGLKDIPLGAVQTNTLDRVNMVGQGQVIPPGNNNPNSGEYFYDYGVGGGAAQGGAQNGVGAQGAPQVHPMAGAGERTHNGHGGSSTGGNGPAFAAGPYSDNAGKGAPLGGAAMNEFNQGPAASTGAASVGGTVAGVVIAVLVLVGIVAVAAVFLVRQRNSRIALSNV